MIHYNLKTLARTKTGYTDLFILKYAPAVVAGTYGDFVKNATTIIPLGALAKGDVVDKILTEVKTEVAGPTATLSVGTGTSTSDNTVTTIFTPASDVATSTTVPYVAGKPLFVGSGYIAASSGGAVTTALTNATSGIPTSGTSAMTGLQARKAINTACNLVATTVLSDVAVTAGEVWIWASIDRVADRVIDA